MRASLAEQGLTLAEVLAALTVLSIGLVAMASLLPLAGLGVHDGGHRSGATFLAAQRLEEIRHAVSEGTDPASFSGEAALAPPHATFRRVVTVRDCGATPGCSGIETPGLRQVTVTVTYPVAPAQGAPSNRRSTVLLSTYVGTR